MPRVALARRPAVAGGVLQAGNDGRRATRRSSRRQRSCEEQRWGFWKCYDRMRNLRPSAGNDKRVHLVYGPDQA